MRTEAWCGSQKAGAWGKQGGSVWKSTRPGGSRAGAALVLPYPCPTSCAVLGESSDLSGDSGSSFIH